MTDILGENVKALRESSRIDLPPASSFTPRALLVGASDDQLRLRTADGRHVRLGSARNARAEADALIAAALGTDELPDTIAVIGAGTGAVLESLEALPARRILIIEPHAELAFPWLSRRPWIDAIRANRLRLVIGPDFLGTAEAARFIEHANRVPVVVHPVLAREYPRETVAARQALDRIVRDARANAHARERFENVAFVNTLRNLPRVCREADAGALAGGFKGVPAIVIGAGPSLDRHRGALADVQNRALLVCADTALQPCVTAGAFPHLVVALDPSPVNARHLAWAGRTPGTHLVAEAAVDLEGPALFGGRTFFFRVGDHAPWPWLRQAGLTRTLLSAWGSVITAALDLAVRAGCSPIVFAGLDLAYTGACPYARHTMFEEIWARLIVQGQRIEDVWATWAPQEALVDESDVNGRPVRTAHHLVAFRDWLREYAASHREVAFVNASGAGILHGPSIALAADLNSALPVATVDVAPRVAARCASSRPDASSPIALARALADAEPVALLDGHSRAKEAEATLAPRALAAEIAASLVRERVPQSAPARLEPAVVSLPIADQVPLWRALRAQRGAAGRGLTPEQERRVRLHLQVAGDKLATIARLRPFVGDGSTLAGLADTWDELPAAALLDWPAAVRPLVHDFSAAMGDALRAADVTPLGEAPGRRPSYWNRPSEVTVGAWEPEHPTADATENARDWAGALVAMQWTLVSCELLDAPLWQQRLTATFESGIRTTIAHTTQHGPRLQLAFGTGLEPDRAVSALLLPYASAPLVGRALTGALIADDPHHGPAQAVERQGFEVRCIHVERLPTPAGRLITAAPLTRVEPDVLTDRGLARAWTASIFDEAHALVVRSDGTGGIVVHESGDWRPSPSGWSPVAFEMARPGGGLIGCDRWPDSRLLSMASAGSETLAREIPWRAYDMCVGGSGLVYVASDAGLWEWDGRAMPRHVAPGPALASVRPDGSGIVAHSLPSLTPDGRRPMIQTRLQWSPGDDRLASRPIGAGEACLSLSVRGRWQAEAWTDASVVRLVHDGRDVYWLACSAPRGVAWAGSSLIVATLPDGDVLRFPFLADTLDRIVGGLRR
jgi:hypothetical protein